MAVRQCPQCASLGTLKSSFRRNSHETFLAVLMPLTNPFRCTSCNWRGMMGRIAIVRDPVLNTAINVILYFSVLIVAIYFLTELRESMHSS
jgi:hypothetical protein